MPFHIDFSSKNKTTIKSLCDLFNNQHSHYKEGCKEWWRLKVGVIANDNYLSSKFCKDLESKQYFFFNEPIKFEVSPFESDKKYEFIIYLADESKSNSLTFSPMVETKDACVVMLTYPPSAGRELKISKKILEDQAEEMEIANIAIIGAKSDSDHYQALRNLIVGEIIKRGKNPETEYTLKRIELTYLRAFAIHYKSMMQIKLISPKITLGIEKILNAITFANTTRPNLDFLENEHYIGFLRNLNKYLFKPTIVAAEELKKYANEIIVDSSSNSSFYKIGLTVASLIGLIHASAANVENPSSNFFGMGAQVICGAGLVYGLSMFLSPKNELSENITNLVDKTKDLKPPRFGK